MQPGLWKQLGVGLGGGIFTYANTLPCSLAWEAFREANGARSAQEMRARIGRYRRAAPGDRSDFEIGCRILTQPFFSTRPTGFPFQQVGRRTSFLSRPTTPVMRMVDMIEDGFDVAIRTVPPPDSSLIVRRLTPWRHILCCTPSYLETHPEPKHPSDLAHHNCLRYAFYPYGDEWRFEAPDGQIVPARVTGNVVTNTAELLRYLTLKGQGIFLAPSLVGADDLANGNLVRLIPDYRPVEFAINAIYPHRHHLSSKVRIFIDLLAEWFAEHRKWMT